MKAFGKWARDRRVDATLTLDAAAQLYGCSRSSVIRMEKGSHATLLATLIGVVDVFGDPPVDVLAACSERDRDRLTTAMNSARFIKARRAQR